MKDVMIGQTNIIPAGIFPEMISHNPGKNHRTKVEYISFRDICLPLFANGCQMGDERAKETPFQGIFGNWSGRGIYQQKQFKEMKKNREYYYGKKYYGKKRRLI